MRIRGPGSLERVVWWTWRSHRDRETATKTFVRRISNFSSNIPSQFHSSNRGQQRRRKLRFRRVESRIVALWISICSSNVWLTRWTWSTTWSLRSTISPWWCNRCYRWSVRSVSPNYMKVKASTHYKTQMQTQISGLSTLCKLTAAVLQRCNVETFLSIGHLYTDCAEERNDWTGQIR